MSHAIAHAQVDPHTRERLEALAREGDRSLAAEIRRALRLHVEREQPRKRRETNGGHVWFAAGFDEFSTAVEH